MNVNAHNNKAGQVDSGLACFYMLTKWHGVPVDLNQLVHELALDVTAVTSADLVLLGRKAGLFCKLKNIKPQRLGKHSMPAIIRANDGQFLILIAIKVAEAGASRYIVQSPFQKMPAEWSESEFYSSWSGDVIFYSSKSSIVGELARFDFSWFVPAIVKYRRPLLEILLVSFVLQIFALATPMFFQVIMDKVLLHNALNTLNVVTFSLLLIVIFEVLLTAFRTYYLAHTCCRIDVELGSRLFNHLLNLPMHYFEARRVGDSVARVQELENIREFLTGNTLTLILDLLFSVLFFVVMFYYSVFLTWIVLASLPLYFFTSFVLSPILRNQLNVKFNQGAENQAYLVESVSGISTVKSMALEPRWLKAWDQKLASYVSLSLKTKFSATVGQNIVSLINKLVTIAITWFGTKLVMNNELSVGELIAFNMLASHVANPIMRLAQMWSDFQQVSISMQRLGDVLNSRVEGSDSKSTVQRLHGRVELQNVSFRYQPGTPETLKDISICIKEGETVAIIGRSGSGKSTLTKLIQRIYSPESGRVLVDGQDLSMIDPVSVRRQIGVVLQENNLFNRTIRQNIAVSEPAASLDSIISVSKISGAHDFISELPQGYDTMIGEHGVGLSGGQRQRIAIARALLSNPRILILDEATSALDYESETIIKNNMNQICLGRTVIVISHRFSTISNVDKIFVIDRGSVSESGTHDELMQNEDGFYYHLVLSQGGR